MTLNDKAFEVAGKMNKPRPFQLGDPVIHKSTGLCGIVESIERIGNTDGQMLTVALLNGKHIRGLRREEFGLHHPGAEQVRAQRSGQTEPQWVKPTPANPQPITVDGTAVWECVGPISTRSILDELS